MKTTSVSKRKLFEIKKLNRQVKRMSKRHGASDSYVWKLMQEAKRTM